MLQSNRGSWWSAVLVVFSLCAACAGSDDGEPNAAGAGADAGVDAGAGPTGVPQLAAAWTRIEPGGETTCSRGDDFHFFVRGGSVNKLAIVFDGGGACWDSTTCGFADQIFAPTADEMLPEPGEGIGEVDNPENPIGDWYAVFIPYCTGDIHWGDSVTTYPPLAEGGEEVVLRHKGQANVRAVLDWVYEHFEKPETILVTGISAGSYGSLGWAPYVMQHYPESFVVQLGDCGAGVITDTFFEESFPAWNADSMIPDWIDGLDVPISELALEDLYIALANAYPQNVFSQYNTHRDENQRFFYTAMGGADEDWSPQMRAKIDTIIAGAPNFRSFIAGGELHGVLPYPELYTYAAGDVRLRDWLADLVEGRDVDNVECVSCDQPELYEP